MYFIIMAMPVSAITGIVVENYDDADIIYSTRFWYDDIVLETNKVVDEYDINKVILVGPQSYTNGIKNLIEKYIDVEIELESGK